VVRRVHPESAVDIYAALELHPLERRTRRTLELNVASAAVKDIEPPASTRQVEASIEGRGSGRSALVLGLEDPGVRDLFGSMCADVANTTAACSTDADAVSAWTGRFAKWRRMLQGGSRGLSPRRQRGLFGELLAIREMLIPSVGFDEAIRAWTGPDGAPRDFELRALGVEVKSSAANEPQVVPVHGERQLDDSGLDALLLVHFSFEILRDAGETLPGMVSSLRDLGEGRAEAGVLDDRLLQSGYLDDHARMYRRTGYSVRRISHFRVRDGFPRIVEGGLVDGIGSVSYRLAIDACRGFEVGAGELTQLLERRP
jgi:hypothetical protein